MNEGFENFIIFLKFIALFSAIISFLTFSIACSLYIDKTHIEEIRYCPECGYNLGR